MIVALIALGATLAKSARLTGSRWAKRDAVEKVERDRPEQPDFLPRALRRGGGEQAEHAGDREDGADDDLGDLVGFAPAFAIPTVEEGDEREEADADDGIEGDEPRGGQLFAHEDEIELLVAPDEVGIEDLVVRHDRDGHHRDENDQGDDGTPVACR